MYPGAAIVLGGGRGQRVGQPKALLPFGQSTFLETILDRLRAVGFAWLGVVLPAELKDQIELQTDRRVNMLINPAPEMGQLSSLHIALRAGAQEFPWLLTALVDHPAVSLSTYELLARHTSEEGPPSPREGGGGGWGNDGPHMWVPSYGGRRGHPVVFGHPMFSDLLRAPAHEGARWAVSRHRQFRSEISVEDPEILLDVDTPEDYRRISHGQKK